MRNNGLLNAEIIKEIAALGHTEYLCIADCGLPLPKGTKVIDISVLAGVPRFTDVLKAIASELVTESIIIAEEIEEVNPQVFEEIHNVIGDLPVDMISHESFKKKTAVAKCIVKTGETSPYANILLVGGVNF